MSASLSGALSIIGREALRIVLPSWCTVCERELPWHDRVASCCDSCWRSLPRITSPKCRSCALPLPAEGICIQCSADPLPVGWCDAWGEYSGALERLLHAFKFERHDFLDAAFARLLHEAIVDRGDAEFDSVVPVPMHRAHERKRGYNQARLLAVALSRLTRIRCESRLLTRSGDSTKQSLLPRTARAANVRRAFKASPAVSGMSVLIVDDICTTGETLRACARELIDAGARRVCAISVAKAV
ncbi:MAG TPA: ComF family protein [Thermoanaerobaculia bacterium]